MSLRWRCETACGNKEGLFLSFRHLPLASRRSAREHAALLPIVPLKRDWAGACSGSYVYGCGIAAGGSYFNPSQAAERMPPGASRDQVIR
jgi:hypothetical protein